MIKSIKFVSIPTRDQDRALRFYTEALGFRVLTDQPFNEKQRWIELGIPGAETNVVLFTPQEHEGWIGSFMPMTFHTDDLQGTYDAMVAKGVEFTTPPTKEHWGEFAMFRDPDGNQFLLSAR